MTNLNRMRAVLTDKAADAAVISSPVNRRYLTGFPSSAGFALVTRDAAWLLVDFRYIEAASAAVAAGFEPVLIEGPAAPKIRELLDSAGASSYLYEDNDLTCAAFARLSGELCKLTPVAAGDAFDRLRCVKTDAELAHIARAQDIADRAFEHILKQIKLTMTETELALELDFTLRRLGSEGVAFDTIAVSGAASALPHGVPRNRPIERGFLVLDFGAKSGGYCSDMTRTVAIGPADADMKRLYSTVLESQALALDDIKPGALCREVDAAARDHIDAAGYAGKFGHGLGHGVGLLVHESPRLSRLAGEERLEVGNVVTVEPGIYLEGKYGCRIEDLVAVTAEGIRNFTRSPKELVEIY